MKNDFVIVLNEELFFLFSVLIANECGKSKMIGRRNFEEKKYKMEKEVVISLSSVLTESMSI